MKKRSVIWAIALAVFAGIAVYLWQWQHAPTRLGVITDKDMAEAVARLRGGNELPATATVIPIDLKRPMRLAIGGLGGGNDEQNQQLEDLVLTDLTGAPGLEMVERQSLDKVLQELNLSISHLVRAQDAVRAGKLLKADWFLLGTQANINGTNTLVVRLVDSRTGIMRDAGVFSMDDSPVKLAADLAGFVRQCRQDAANPKPKVYLAIGTFQDVGLNNRQAAFPTQLRAFLTAAYQGGNVTLLERETADILYREMRLDLVGLAENGATNPPSPLQSAYWLVNGDYQSYETTNFQVEVALRIHRMFGRASRQTLRGPPDQSLFASIKDAIDRKMKQDASPMLLSLANEANFQMQAGKELAGDWLVYLSGFEEFDEQEFARRHRNAEEAIQAFEAVLLLQPTNREATMRLAACFRNQTIARVDEARKLYREIIEEPVQDKWTGSAERALEDSFLYSDPTEKARWFAAAIEGNTNSTLTEFYRRNAETATRDATIENGGDAAVSQAEQRLFDAIQGKSGAYREDLFMGDYVKIFGSDRATAAQKLAALLPEMKRRAPDMEPYLVATVLTFQVDTNTPLVAEFQRLLKDCVEHPDRVSKPEQFWYAIRWSVYDWCFEKTNYSLAVNLIEGERRVAAGGKVDFNDQEKIKLAYAYLAAQRWRDALGIFESFNNQPVHATGSGPWGKAFQSIQTDKMAAFCRMKLGLAAAQDQRSFEMSAPLLCFCTPFNTPSTFVSDESGLWIGIGGQLRHLGFDLKTNLVINLPIGASVPITALCLTSSNVWIGTGGAGLIEFDKSSRQCRRLVESDGLMMDGIASLEIAGDSLWIGYGGAAGGGLGRMDLLSGKLSSFMPSINSAAVISTGEPPPREAIGRIVAGADGDLWVFVASGIRQFHVKRNVWESLPRQTDGWVYCFCADSKCLVEGVSINLSEIGIEDLPDRNAPDKDLHKTNMVVTTAEENQLRQVLRTNGSNRYVSSMAFGGIRPRGALAIQSLRDRRWQILEDADGFPNPPTTMTLDGDNLWVGGEGYIALVDLKENKVTKFSRITARSVDQIQIGGGYVWAQFDWQLFRAPIGELQHGFLQSNFAKFAPVQFQKTTNGTAILQRLRTGANIFEHKGTYYCGFKFTVPQWLDGDARLLYVMAKSEAEKDFSVNYMISDIIPENGPSAGSFGFLREDIASYPLLQVQFPYTGKLTTQTFDIKRLEPGKTYGIWFEFDRPDLPDIAFAMTINSPRGTNEFGMLPLR